MHEFEFQTQVRLREPVQELRYFQKIFDICSPYNHLQQL